MANLVIVQVAMFSAAAAILICVLVLYKRRSVQVEAEPPRRVPKVRPMVERSQSVQPQPIETNASRQPVEADRQAPLTVKIETVNTTAPASSANTDMSSTAPSADLKPTAIIDVQAALTTSEDRNERILAGISQNIRKSMQMRPVPQHSPIPYSESQPRNTEYVRVKKDIITPHGQIRFSILKDWMSINMLAVFRRASLDWKTPDDLIAFLPAYLEPEAEILNNEVLLIRTPGHPERLAVPIRSLIAESSLRDCFDFVTDVPTATNTPAVLLPSDSEFEVVSRGVITQGVFMNAVDQGQTEVKLLVERSAALPRMEHRIAADVH
jgi:hypothetical protein